MDNREADRASHPPACTCKDCVARRLGKVRERGRFRSSSKISQTRDASSDETVPPRSSRESGELPKWLLTFLLIFALSVLGFGIVAVVGSPIPLWLLLGFSIIYSIERWFNPVTRKVKAVGKLYRLALNLSTLSMLGLLVLSGVWLFSEQLAYSPLVGSLIFLAELIFFIWLYRIVSKNSWRQPSMKLTVFSLICLFLIFSFAGVQPMASYKDNAIGKISNFINEQEIKAEERKTAEENRRAVEKAEMDAAGVVSEYDFYEDYVVLFNEFRSGNARPPLVFDTALNKLASERAIEISQPGNFSHEGINKYNLGENIAMMAYSSDSASELIELWASSPGHRSNMILSSYHRTGFAKNGKYAVQIFD